MRKNKRKTNKKQNKFRKKTLKGGNISEDETYCKYLSMYAIIKASNNIKNLYCINFNDGIQSFKIPNEKFVLFTYSDGTVPDDNIEKTNEILSSPNLIHWYAQNLIKHDNQKLSSIPIGIDYHTIDQHKSGYEWWGPKETPLQQEKLLIELLTKANPLDKREIKLYCNFYNTVRGKYGEKDRKEALEQIPNNLFYIEKNSVPRKDSWTKMSSLAFVASPLGNGLDCHRTWEALALGCMPVVKKSNLDPLYKDLPVLIVNNWSDINIELLNKTISEFKNKTFNLEKLTYKYWIGKIKNLLNIPFIFIHLGEDFFPEYVNYTFKQCKKWNPNNEIYFICSLKHIDKFDKNMVNFIDINKLNKSEHHIKYSNDVQIDEGFRNGFWRFTTERFFTLEDFCIQYDIKEFLHLENDNMIYFTANDMIDILRNTIKGIASPIATHDTITMGIFYCNNIDVLIKFNKFLLDSKSGSGAQNNEMQIGEQFFIKNPTITSYLPSIPSVKSDISESNIKKITNNIDLFKGVFDPGQYGTWIGGIDPRNGHYEPFTYMNNDNIITPNYFTYELKVEPNNYKRYHLIRSDKNIDYPIYILHIHSKKLEEFYF